MIASLIKYMTYFILSWPLISLITWAIVVFKVNDNDATPGLAILLIGLCVIFNILGILYLRESNFR